MNISIIGYGNMAKAIVKRLVSNPSYRLRVSSPSLTRKIDTQRIHYDYDNVATVAEADIIILATKPNIVPQILKEIQGFFPQHSLIISVAAGLKLPYIESCLPAKTAVIRTMPNIAAAIGESATPLFANAYVTDLQKKSAEQIFLNMGITSWALQENDIDTFTALSGSGPAYVLLFIESMIKAAVNLGLTETTATSFALQTVKGTLNLATSSEINLEKLRSSVTSPGGTTAAGLQVLMQQSGLETLISKAIQAARQRAHELSDLASD